MCNEGLPPGEIVARCDACFASLHPCMRGDVQRFERRLRGRLGETTRLAPGTRGFRVDLW